MIPPITFKISSSAPAKDSKPDLAINATFEPLLDFLTPNFTTELLKVDPEPQEPVQESQAQRPQVLMRKLGQGVPVLPGCGLPAPSEEQQLAINYFKAGFNLKIEATAGSGKSTTLLWLCQVVKHHFQSRALILTYNKALQAEISQKVQTAQVADVAGVYTYHGFASLIYRKLIHTDLLLRQELDANSPITASLPEVILIDEVQDMNGDYYRLVRNLLSHGKILVLVGDRRQCINAYAGADPRFLIDFETHFDTGRPWQTLALRTSYRLTPALAHFINRHIVGENLIIGGNQTSANLRPTYKYGEYNLRHIVEKMVKIYGPDEVAILTPSVKNVGNPKSPLGRLLGQKSNVLLAIIDDYASPESTIGKVVVATFNSFKGRERKCILVTNFDESYFDYYARDWLKTETSLPNIIYVAVSRAREKLILVQGDKKLPFRTIKPADLPLDCLIDGTQKDRSPIKLSSRPRRIADLIRHRHLDDVAELLALIQIKTIQPSGPALPSQDKVQFPGYVEDVRAFYNLLIPIYYQHLQFKSSAWLQQGMSIQTQGELPRYDETTDTVTYFSKMPGGFADVGDRLNTLFNQPDKNLQEWMEIVVLNSALLNRWHFYKDQIKDYNWVDTTFIEAAVARLGQTIPPGGVFEQKYGPKNGYNIKGIVNYVTPEALWEFKCAPSITDEHKLQAGAYAALHLVEHGQVRPCRILNLKTGEVVEVRVDRAPIFLQILTRQKLDL